MPRVVPSQIKAVLSRICALLNPFETLSVACVIYLSAEEERLISCFSGTVTVRTGPHNRMSPLRKYSQRLAVFLNGPRPFAGSVALQLLLAVLLVATVGLFALSRFTSVQAREEAAAPVAQVESAPSPGADLSEAPSSESPFEKIMRRSQRPAALAALPVELTLTEKLNQGVLALLILLTIVLLVPKASRALGEWLAASDRPGANPKLKAAELLSRVALAEEHASFDSFVSSFRVGVQVQVPPVSKPAATEVASPTPSVPPRQQTAQPIKDARAELASLRLFLRELNL